MSARIYECDGVEGDTFRIDDVEEFIANNEFEDDGLGGTIRQMQIGEEIIEGGGAAPIWKLRRLS